MGTGDHTARPRQHYDGPASLPEGATIFPVASCYRNPSLSASLMGHLAWRQTLPRLVWTGSPQSNAKTYVTSGCQCLENLYQFKAFTERSS